MTVEWSSLSLSRLKKTLWKREQKDGKIQRVGREVLQNSLFWPQQSCCMHKLMVASVTGLKLHRCKSPTFQLHFENLLEEIWAILNLGLTALLCLERFFCELYTTSKANDVLWLVGAVFVSSQSWTDVRPCSSWLSQPQLTSSQTNTDQCPHLTS